MSIHGQKQRVIIKRQTQQVNCGYSFINKLPRSVGVEYDHNVPGSGRYIKPFDRLHTLLDFGLDDHYELRTVPAKGDALLATLLIVKQIAQRSRPPEYRDWGLHVHVDALDLSTPEIIRFVYIYQYIQSTIQNQVFHPERKRTPYSTLLCPLPPSNNKSKTGLVAFCTQDQTKDMLYHVFSRDKNYISRINFANTTHWWPQNLGRFSIALASLGKYGTIEFRSKEAVANRDPIEDVVYWPLFCGWLIESVKRVSDFEIVKILDPTATTKSQKQTNTFKFLTKFIPQPIVDWFTNHAYAGM